MAEICIIPAKLKANLRKGKQLGKPEGNIDILPGLKP